MKPPSKDELKAKRLGLSACARVMGCTPANISKLEKKGTIPERGDDKLFDMDAVKEAYAAMNPLSRDTGKYGGANGNPGAKQLSEVEEEENPSGLIGKKSIADIKKDSEFWKSKLSEAKYLKEIGQLVDMQVVEDVIFGIGKRMQAKMMAWEPRFKAHMTETGKETVKEEIRELLEEMIEDLGRIVGEDETKVETDGDQPE